VRILIIGAGQVGSSIAENLSESHKVVIMDIDPVRVSDLSYSYDVLAICGDGNNIKNLEEVGKIDLFLACTNDDEKNLIACESSKMIGDAFTVARVKNSVLFESWSRSKGSFGVDFMACSDRLISEAIIKITGTPAALDADYFADGKIQMAEFEINPNSFISNKTVLEADQFELLTFAAIITESEIIIPTGSTMILPGHRIVVIGTPESVKSFSTQLEPTTKKTQNIVLIGGSSIIAETASLFSSIKVNTTLITSGKDASLELAKKLPNTMVMCHDISDIRFLEAENINQSDLVVVHLSSDEKTLLISLLIKQLGVRRIVSIVNSGSYVSLFENVGIDVAVNPRELISEAIIGFTHQVNTEHIALLDSNRVELLEVEIGSDSNISGKTIQEISSSMPNLVLIGAIVRDEQAIAPRGDTTIKYGDHIVILTDVSVLDKVLQQL
jgi:trk system potassium uptake protein TrkA